MLDEPEAAASRAAALDCRDRLPCAGKKLIQARLPFKRLSIPKVKSEARQPPCTSLEGKVPDLEPSLDNLEHTCHTASNLDLSPKLVNGRGPMDSFLGRMNPGQGVVIIDLTEDSNDLPESPVASLAQATVNGVSLGPPEQQGPACAKDSSEEPVCLPDTLPDLACPGEDKSRGLEGPGRTGGCQVGSLQSYPNPTAGPRLCPKMEKDGWIEAGGILFKEKLPVVLLQDILASKRLTASPPSTPLDRSIASESELLESCPEDDFINSHSSLSSASPDSSPEGPGAAPPQHPWTSPPCTPVCTTPKRLVKGSTDKSKTRLQRDRVQLREEKEKLREEARRAREQARRKKEEEKELKEKEKAEKQRLKEEEKELKEKERREKREKDEKEKAEKQRLKEERRKERQEALEAKLEEKRKKEEEKRLREEEKRIKAEKAEITRFFQKPKTPQAPKTLAGSCGKFAPFEIKEHMVLAPQCRAVLDRDLCARLDQFLQQQNGSVSFLEDLKTRQPLTSGPTRSFGRDTGIVNRDVVIMDSIEVDGVPKRKKFGRMKLLQFSENHRPAYWGTWNKKTAIIRPRDPWAQDKNLFDYEVDSDEEWEEEEPGESLSHSEGDEDDDVGEDEDEDDGFFVPHGYLSEDEGVTEECADPENQKVRQKLKAEEWDELLAKGKRFRVLQPVQVGCVWASEVASSGADIRLLQQFSARLLDTAPSDDEPAPKASKREKDQQILAQLLPLLHGNVNGSKVIIQEFQEHCRRGLLSPQESQGPQSPLSSPQSPDAMVPSKARLKRLISENSAYEKRPDFRMCWYVHPQVLRSFGQERLPVPCQWTYVTTSPVPREDSGVPAAGPSQSTPVLLKRKPGGSMCITQFMKKRRHEGQAVAGDMDGFQADTEEEEDDDDCMIVDGPDVEDTLEPCGAAGRLPTSLLGTS